MPPSPRLRVVKEVAERLGLGGLAELEARLVRERPVPTRLIAALVTEKNHPKLTDRQYECMVLLASGYERREIADEMGLGVETVKSHLRYAYLKLGASNSVEAVNIFLGRAA